MLTNFVEKQNETDENCICKTKAEKYFPFMNEQGKFDEYKIKNSDHTTDSGHFVTATEGSKTLEKIFAPKDLKTLHDVKKSLDVKKLSFKKGTTELHKVTHIHFKVWLDFGVPNGEEKINLENLVRFIWRRLMRERM